MKHTYITSILAIMMLTGMTACSLDETLSADSEDYGTLNLALVSESIDAFPSESLSDDEITGLLLMREEEKLARDVYLHLYESWEMNIFSNIAASEATHMGALLLLLDRYDLEDPVGEDVVGSFENETLADLYTGLCNQGDESLVAALGVGATIEDLDIKDLMELSEAVDNEDILFTYESLTKGSRNHIRSFASLMDRYDESYTAQFIEQSLLDSILATPKEIGNW